MKYAVTILVLILGLQAHADLGAGVLFSGAQDTWDASGTNLTGVKADGMTTRYGVMVWFPLIPGLGMRVGYLLETQKLTSEYSNLSPVDTTAKNSLVPVNLQLGLPITDLYVFGGAIFVSNDKVEPSGTMNSDLRINLGAGYSVIDLGLAKLNLELEYQKGTRNLSSSPGFDLKNQSIALNIGAQFGF
ncbi:MAG: hypothetical protein ACXWC9_08305 [Pseudobdellovibrionaceae bacterium]